MPHSDAFHMLRALAVLKSNCHSLHIRVEVSDLFLHSNEVALPHVSSLHSLLGDELGVAGTRTGILVLLRICKSSTEDRTI